jgi:ligand-binding sensor domain-containing protein
MNKPLAIIFVFTLFMLSSWLPVSQAEEWVSYTVGHGLIDNAINAITVDNNRKAVWFGTRAGASMFDGYQWKSYLEGLYVRDIAVDPEGKVWFGTSEGVKVLDGDEWREDISDLFMQDVGIDQEYAKHIRSIAVDQQGVKWFGTNAGIRSTIDGLSWKSYKESETRLLNDIITSILPSLPGVRLYGINISDLNWVRNWINSIAIDSHGNKWLAMNAIFSYIPDPNYEFVLMGLGFFDGSNWRLIPESCKFDVYTYSAITSVAVDADDNIWYGIGEIWYGIGGSGAFKFDGKKITRYFSQDINGNGKWEGRQSFITVSDLNGDGNKEIAAIAWSDFDLQPRGLYIYDISGREKWHYKIGPNHQSSEAIAIGDVNGDRISEIVMGSGIACNLSEANETDDCHGYIFIMDWVNKKNLWGSGISKPITNYGGGIEKVAIADLDRDGINDIIGFVNWKSQWTSEGDESDIGIIVTDANGREKMRYTHIQPRRAINQGAIADLDNDGDLEIIALDYDPYDPQLYYSLKIFDHNLSLLFESSGDEFQGVQLVAVADLYGDGIPEILLTDYNHLFVVSYIAEENKLEELWRFPGNGESIPIKRVRLSDLYPGGSTEILISADKHYILSADVQTNAPLSSVDTGWRHGEMYDLERTLFYPHAPTIPIPSRPFVIKKVIELPPSISGHFLTGDVNGDGLLDIVQTYEDKISVISREGDVESPWEVLWTNSYPCEYKNVAVTALDDVMGGGELEILADVLLDGKPQLLFIYGENGAIIKSIPCEAGVTDQLRDNYVYAIEVDQNGNIWFGTYSGVSKFNGKDDWISYTADDGLIDNTVLAIAFDESNNVWFGTPSGVTRYDRTWMTQPSPDVKADTITLQVDINNSVWAGTWGDGVYRYDNGRKTHYMSFPGKHFQHYVYSMLVDSENRALWVSTWMGGIDWGVYKIDIDSPPPKEPPEPKFTYQNTGGQLVSNRVTAMAKDSLGRLWFGTAPHRTYPDVGCGISMYDASQNKWEKFPFQPDSEVIPEHITVIKAAKDGVLWFGSLEQGVRSYDGTAWKIYTVEYGLADNSIEDIEEDATGALWFATSRGRGVSRYHPSTGDWKTVTTANGLADNAVWDIEIAGNDVWFATSGGVSKFDGEHWITYDRNDGLPSNFVLSLVIDRNGTLWIGTKGGLVSKRLTESDLPETIITSKPEKNVGFTGVAFEFTGRDLGTDTPDLLYQYKLVPEGVLPEKVPWSKCISETKKAYTDLSD